MPAVNGVGKPCAGEPHARIDGRELETGHGSGHGGGEERPTGNRMVTAAPRLPPILVTAPAPDPPSDVVGQLLSASGACGGDTETAWWWDESPGRDGLDFLGCHFRARMSGRLWEQRRVVRYCLHRWPSQRAMARMRAKVRDRTGRSRVGIDIRDVIADLNPVLRGWGNYFRTGNAAQKFRQIDQYVVRRLFRLMVKKRGRNLRAGQADQWTEEWFNGHGLHRLRGTIRYPKAA
jgi:hypothetical protein